MRTLDNMKHFDGFPRKLKLYSSTSDDEPYVLKAVFSGIQMNEIDNIQFVLENPILCKKIKLEFHEISVASSLNSNEKLAAVSNLVLFENLGYDITFHRKVSGWYSNSNYIDSHKIKSFTASTNGDRSGYSITNALSSDSQWISGDKQNDGTFTPTIYVNFTESVLFEAFVYKVTTRKKLTTTYYDGFPSKIILYTALNEEDEFTQHTMFIGSRDGANIQFVLLKPIRCKKIKLELLEVGEFNKEGKYASTQGISLLRSFEYELREYESAHGNYQTGTNYINFHLIPPSSFKISANSERVGNEISLTLDDNDDTTWITAEQESDTFHPTVYVNFTEPTLFEAFIYVVTSAKKTSGRNYYGYPDQLLIYTALEEEEPLTPQVMFQGSPSDTHLQFVLGKPINCTRIALEFHYVHEIKAGGHYASADGFQFLRSFEYDLINYEKATGNYADTNYINFHLIPPSSFKISANSERAGNEINLTLDDNDDSTWVTAEQESATFHPTVYINFTEPTLFEAFIYVVTSAKKTGGRDYFGYPEQLLIYTALEEEEPLTPKILFQGSPSDTHLQFVLPEPINYTRIALEFYYVHEIKAGGHYASADGFQFLQSYNEDGVKYQPISGKYIDKVFVDEHKVPFEKIASYNSNGEKTDHQLKDIFTDKSNEYWISDKDNVDDFKASIYINFTEPVLLEAFIINSTRNNGNDFNGFPLRLNAYSSLNDGKFDLRTKFVDCPLKSWKPDILFILPAPIMCTYLQLEFVQITSNSLSNNEMKASIAGIIFVSQEPIQYENNNFTGDIDVIVADDKLYLDEISNTSFIDFILPKDKDYLFVVEKKFAFYNDTFSCEHHSVGAIQGKSVSVPQVTVEKCKFNSCTVKSSQENGGAINFINCGINCQTSNFSNCVSTTGGKGGAIYLCINRSIQGETLISGCTFESCTACLGGGLFIYSIDASKSVTVMNCMFKQNSVVDSKSNENSPCGSAMYLKTKNSVVKRCKFIQNKGKDSLSIIYNLDKEEIQNDSLVSLSEKQKMTSLLLVEDCTFNVDYQSKSSISLVHDSNEKIPIIIKNCSFEGKLGNGLHHINGFVKNDLKMIKIVSCNFESGRNGAVNLKSKDFNYSLDKKNLAKLAAVICGAVFMVSAIIVLIINVRNNNSNDDDDNDL